MTVCAKKCKFALYMDNRQPTPGTVSPPQKPPLPIKIDVEAVVRARVPGLARFIPKGVFNWLRRTICEDELNALLRENAGLEGADFCRGVIKSLNISVETQYEERLPDPAHRRVVFVSNHPLGGLDGMILIDLVQRYYGGQVWFVVNDLLMYVEPLKPVFLPVNKHGRQDRASIRRLDEAFAGDDPIIIFPAGLVSRLRNVPLGGKRRKMIADLPWRKMFVKKCREFKRDIIPVYFDGQNSMKFYKMANLRKNLGLKFNLEQVYLPSEVIKARGRGFRVLFGNPLSPENFVNPHEDDDLAHAIGGYVYMLPHAEFDEMSILNR